MEMALNGNGLRAAGAKGFTGPNKAGRRENKAGAPAEKPNLAF